MGTNIESKTSSMIREYYFIDILSKRLRYQQEWVRDVQIYKQCIGVCKKVEVEMFKEKPIIYLLLFFYFLPIKTLKFFINIKNEYSYKKALKEIEVIENEIRSLKKI